ncbi:MAG: hypothetical protein AABY22_25570 [Nanoarchaeota archaeon]
MGDGPSDARREMESGGWRINSVPKYYGNRTRRVVKKSKLMKIIKSKKYNPFN